MEKAIKDFLETWYGVPFYKLDSKGKAEFLDRSNALKKLLNLCQAENK